MFLEMLKSSRLNSNSNELQQSSSNFWKQNFLDIVKKLKRHEGWLVKNKQTKKIIKTNN